VGTLLDTTVFIDFERIPGLEVIGLSLRPGQPGGGQPPQP
jgi:hypothetical protein